MEELSKRGQEDRLIELGLREEYFAQAAHDGMSAYNLATDHHPRTTAGSSFWSEFVASIRMSLIPRNWSAEYIGGHDVTLSPDQRRAIVVTRGDAGTGDLDGSPRTKARKGKITEAAIKQNSRQARLIPIDQLPPVVLASPVITLPPDLKDVELWMALYHRDFEAKKIWMELSLPTGLDEQEKAWQWSERIPLSPVDMEGVAIDAEEMSFQDGPSIEVEVIRHDGTA